MTVYLFLLLLRVFFLIFNVQIRNGKQVYCGELWDPKQKKIAVHDTSHDTLLKLIKERFQVQSPDIKYYDQDVDDCVDFDRDANECIATLKVLKLRVKETQLLNEDENVKILACHLHLLNQVHHVDQGHRL